MNVLVGFVLILVVGTAVGLVFDRLFFSPAAHTISNEDSKTRRLRHAAEAVDHRTIVVEVGGGTLVRNEASPAELLALRTALSP